jgi:PAS domain S-box-containing protein
MITSDKHQIEQELRESQARLANIIASAMDAIITIDDQQHILLFNSSAEKMFGYPAREIIGQSLDLLIPERFRSRHREQILRFGQTGITNRSMGRLGTLYGLRASGEEFQMEASISQVDSAGGKLYTVILRDVSERLEAERKLRENEEELRAAFEQAAVGFAYTAPDGRFLRVNEKLCEITGYSQEELLTKTFQEITEPDDLQRDLEQQAKLLAGEIGTYTLEKRYYRKDASRIWIRLTASLMNDIHGNPKYFIKVTEDITQRKQAEIALQAKNDEMNLMTQQLWQSAKLATMGELAASIAHELNNPLAIVSLRIESLLSDLADLDPGRRELVVIAGEVDRMASLVANLLQFSRSTERQVSSLDIREEVDNTLELIHSHLRNRRISLQRDFAADIPLIQADRQGLRQLFLNLFTNASDAMPAGGTLKIRIVYLKERRRILIEVHDTGFGIDPKNLPHVLDPFFSTKVEGKGTGLGLSICRRIVEEHQGQIQIASPGRDQGTTIRIELPGVNSTKPVFLDE